MSITNQFLNKQLGFAGHIRHDMRALEWIRKRKPYSLHDPLLPASQDIKAIAANLLGEQYERHRPSLADKFRNVFGLGLKKSA
jgi:MinD-like ATPase involved in chromosome partitioning or flagellar assembly